MSCEDEVLSIRKKLEKMSGEGADQTQALDLLNSLGQLKINLSILTSTMKQKRRICFQNITNCNFGCQISELKTLFRAYLGQLEEKKSHFRCNKSSFKENSVPNLGHWAFIRADYIFVQTA